MPGRAPFNVERDADTSPSGSGGVGPLDGRRSVCISTQHWRARDKGLPNSCSGMKLNIGGARQSFNLCIHLPMHVHRGSAFGFYICHNCLCVGDVRSTFTTRLLSSLACGTTPRDTARHGFDLDEKSDTTRHDATRRDATRHDACDVPVDPPSNPLPDQNSADVTYGCEVLPYSLYGNSSIAVA